MKDYVVIMEVFFAYWLGVFMGVRFFPRTKNRINKWK